MRIDGDINEILHAGRGAYLRTMPSGAKTFLSAGCAGLWYFEWIERCYGKIPLHIGLEYYSPKPDDLPDNVRWIENTCSDMHGVDSDSCDIVFSGQNLEHLWPNEIEAFMLEVARVTRSGGHLIMDSPNRAVTELLRNWSHPEHIIEFTAKEAAELVRLAGFDVKSIRGIWLNRDSDGHVIPFNVNQPDWNDAERLILAYDRPEDSFIWWIEAQRVDRRPKLNAMRKLIAQVYSKAWPERKLRMCSNVGSAFFEGDEEWIAGPALTNDALLFGPYMPLRAGRYKCTFEVSSRGNTQAYFDVIAGDQPIVINSRVVNLESGKNTVSIDFELEKLHFGVQYRCLGRGGAAFSVRRRVEVEEFDAPAYP